MSYERRWSDAHEALPRRGPEAELPWIRALDEARAKARHTAYLETVAAHMDEFYRRFDDEMDRLHAEIATTFADAVAALKADPDFSLVAPTAVPVSETR